VILSFSEGAEPRRLGWQRRVVVIALGAILATMACGIVGIAFVQSTPWYSYGTDRALDRASRAHVEAIRHEVDATGMAAEAVTWLDAALDPQVDPTTVRTYLLAAQEKLRASDDPVLAGAAQELQAIIHAIRPAPLWETSMVMGSGSQACTVK
jgi:hypothetical protein